MSLRKNLRLQAQTALKAHRPSQGRPNFRHTHKVRTEVEHVRRPGPSFYTSTFHS